MSGQSENVSHAHRECMKLRDRVKELEAALAAAEAQVQAQQAALGRVDALTAKWFEESDALFGALPADPAEGVKLAGRASELEARADKLYAARWGQS